MNLTTLKLTVTAKSARQLLVIKKYSPELLLTAGIIGVLGSTVMACKATTKSEEIIKEFHKKRENIRTCVTTLNEDEYSKKDEKKDTAIAYTQTAVNFAKLYSKSIICMGISIGCILGSYKIIKMRNVGLAAAYKAVDEAFKKYRQNVKNELGEEVDYNFKNNVKKTIEVDENGGTIETMHCDISQYAKFFDESNINWTKSPEENMVFLKHQQNYCNDLINIRGHVFLNEVYDHIGIPRTKAGAIVGWTKESGNYIDFGLFNKDCESIRDFVNGIERTILLDFNVDGIILDLI